MSRFQIILIAIFSFAAVLGVFFFATFQAGSGEPNVNVVMWGTLPEDDFIAWYSGTATNANVKTNVTYVAKHPDRFDQEFVEALADGRGPDIIFLPHEKILEHQNRIFKIPYTTFDERQYKDLFVEEAELYLSPEGIYALPLYIDPLVMYWNRDIFRNAGIAEVPKYWDEFPDISLELTKKDGAGNITQSAVALGEFTNIHRARELISILLMQAGTPITQVTPVGIQSVLPSGGSATSPADAALTFYTQFANPAKDIHSWNRSFPNSLTTFASGDLGIFFGLASDLFAIQDRNPNLNFDVAPLPQPRDASVRMTFGSMHGLALVRQTSDLAGSYRIIQELTSREAAQWFSDVLKVPPARRDLLVERPTDAYLSLFYDSSLISRAWLSPLPKETDAIFKEMIESVTGGRQRLGEAIQEAHQSLERVLGN